MRKPFWVDENTWYCPNHLPGVRLPAGLDSCWYNNCRSERPAMEMRPAAPEPVLASTPKPTPEIKPQCIPQSDLGVAKCAWHECNEPASKKSKYCSRNCSNKNARARYKARKAA